MLLATYFTYFAFYSVIAASCLVLVVSILELVRPGYLPRACSDGLSYVINAYLHHTFPIKQRDGSRDLPGCPYHWPNGQGDSAKFLSGIENSAKWQELYGSIYRIWAGTKPEIVLTKPHQLQIVFRDSNKHIKAAANDSGAYMGQLLGKCVGLISGEDWRRVRSIVEIPFGHQTSLKRVENIERQVADHFQQLQASGRLKDELLHPAEDLKMLPFWVVCEVFYGRLPPHLLQELSNLAPLREKIFRYVIQGGLTRFSWAQWLPTTANVELRAFQAQWKAFNDAAYRYALKQDQHAPIVQMYDEKVRGKITEDQLLQTLDESLYANLDVTTGGLSWNFVFLAAHPEIQSRLRSELQRALQTAQLGAYVQSEATYLAACVLESSRLKPLAAFSVPQAAPTEREVDGYIIPAGTNFVIDAYGLNIHSDTWAPDNTTYRPDRFMGRRGTDLRYSFWRFGFGPRQCMGKYVADLMIRQTLAYLILRYELSWVDKENWSRNKESWITHPDFTLRCAKRDAVL